MYVVRQFSTNKYFPQTKNGRGGTWCEPVEFDGSAKTLPRLFANKKAAKEAIRWWKKGQITFGPMDEWGNIGKLETKAVETRKNMDFVIEQVRLQCLDYEFQQ